MASQKWWRNVKSTALHKLFSYSAQLSFFPSKTSFFRSILYSHTSTIPSIVPHFASTSRPPVAPWGLPAPSLPSRVRIRKEIRSYIKRCFNRWCLEFSLLNPRFLFKTSLGEVLLKMARFRTRMSCFDQPNRVVFWIGGLLNGRVIKTSQHTLCHWANTAISPTSFSLLSACRHCLVTEPSKNPLNKIQAKASSFARCEGMYYDKTWNNLCVYQMTG